MKKCITCSNKVRTYKYLLCFKCARNPFRTEDLREYLAKSKEFKKLKETYSAKFPQIKDNNTNPFWNNKFKVIDDIQHQDGMTQDRVRQVERYIPKDKIRLLDVGAGLGFIEELLKKRRNVELYANDISQVSIDYLRRVFKGKFKRESLYTMQYYRNFFDVVLLLEVLEHIPPKKTFYLLYEIKKMLKKNGTFIISIPINESLEHMSENLNSHVRTYTEDLIRAELSIAGFKVIEIQRLYAFEKHYKIKKLLSMILINRWRPNNLVIKSISI